MWIAEKASKFDADGIDIHFLNACDPQTELAGKNMTASAHLTSQPDSSVLTLVFFCRNLKMCERFLGV